MRSHSFRECLVSPRQGSFSVIVVLLFAGFSTPALAHPESLSNLRLVIGATELRATLTLPVRDLTRWFPPGGHANYTGDVVDELQRHGATLLGISWDDEAVAVPRNVNVHPGKTGFIIAEIRYATPAGGNTLVVHSTHLGNLPNDHQQVAWAEDERSGISASRVIAEQILTAQEDTLTIELPEVVSPPAIPPAIAAPQNPPVPAGRVSSFPPSLRSIVRIHTRLVFLCSLVLVVVGGIVGYWRVHGIAGRGRFAQVELRKE
jgi:hypothetical protein